MKLRTILAVQDLDIQGNTEIVLEPIYQNYCILGVKIISRIIATHVGHVIKLTTSNSLSINFDYSNIQANNSPMLARIDDIYSHMELECIAVGQAVEWVLRHNTTISYQ